MPWQVGSIPLGASVNLYSAWHDVPLTLPERAKPGDRFIASVIQVDSAGSSYNLQGHQLLGVTGWQRPADSFGNSFNNRLVNITGVLGPTMQLPTFGNTGPDQPWILAVFNGNVQVVDYAQAQVNDSYSGVCPAVATGVRTLRIWTTYGRNPYIVVPPDVSEVAGSNPEAPYMNVEQQAATIAYDDGAAKTATCRVAAGWHNASFSVSG